MSQKLGVQATAGMSNKVGHDTTGSQAPILHIDHTYYLQAQELESESQYVVMGQIQVKNTGGPTLENICIYLNIQGSAQEMFSNPYVCDPAGNPIPPAPGSSYPALYFGNLAPGASSSVLCYFWTVRSGFSSPIPDTETFTVTPILIPQFTVSYSQIQGFDTDTTTVRVSS